MIRNDEAISKDTRESIKGRYERITRAINRRFWNSDSLTAHSLYVGSYGRGTAIDTSDIDIVVELPLSEKERVDNCERNGQSYLLQLVKNAILDSYPRSDIHADGQVVVVEFWDGMKFEVVPVFRQTRGFGSEMIYVYPDANKGGRWRSTNPKAEQEAINEKNSYVSNGLLKDTCKSIRRVHCEFFSSLHLSGILIDSFVYQAIGDWRWPGSGESGGAAGAYERALLDYYNQNTYAGAVCLMTVRAPGSGMEVDTKDWVVLGKVLRKMAE